MIFNKPHAVASILVLDTRADLSNFSNFPSPFLLPVTVHRAVTSETITGTLMFTWRGSIFIYSTIFLHFNLSDAIALLISI